MRRERLIAARKATGMTQEQLAEALKVDRTTISAWERGERTPLPDQRPDYAEHLSVSMEELHAMLSSIPSDANETPDWLATYLGMEQSATEMQVHEPRAVFGLLQTPAYTEHLVGRVGVTGVSDTYLQRTIEQRLHRQKRVRDGDLNLDVVQPECALGLRVGDGKVMAEQLDTLAELAEQPNVTVRVTLSDQGQYEARRLGDFAILTHPWGRPRVHIEGYGGGRFITDADEVAYFWSAFDHATRVALSPKESLAFLKRNAERWRNRHG
jgi:transcriptional regulator with XRE-family HTH domain